MSESLEVSRVVQASVERVWKALTDSKELGAWFSPEGMEVTVSELDVREGGAYRITMSGPDGDHTGQGVYTRVDDINTLEFSWQWEGDSEQTTVTIELRDVGEGKTKVVLRHSGFATAESRDRHQEGWESTFNKFKKLFA